MAIWRRAVIRPSYLETSLDDWFALILLLVIFVQGFVIEGARLAVPEPSPMTWAIWSPGGYAVWSHDAEGFRIPGSLDLHGEPGYPSTGTAPSASPASSRWRASARCLPTR